MNFASKSVIHENSLGSFTCRKAGRWDILFYFPSEGRHTEDFPDARKIQRLRQSLGYHKQQQFVNFRWTFSFCVEKSYDGTHLAFGGTLDRRCHFKNVSIKQSRSNEHGSQVKDQGRRQCCHNKHKKFPIGLHLMYPYFPDTRHMC